MSSFRFTLIALAAGAALAACTPVRSYHGYLPETQEIEVTAAVGQDDRQSVYATLGEPSTIGLFDQNTWYYISSRERRYGFFKDKTTWRRVVAISFGPDGRVAQVDEYNLDDGKQIALVGRTTPTRGKELSVLEQIFGNVGQLPTQAGGAGPGGPGGPGAP